MALLQYTIVVCFTILNLVVIIDGLRYKPQSEEHGTHNGWTQKRLCKKTERLFVKSCLENPDRNLCLKLQRTLKRGRCTPACRMSTACEESEQMCRTDCDEGDVVPGLCGRHEKCCLADIGMDECPTSDEGVTCESADNCTGSGVTVDSGFACSTGEGQVCCRRECPESDSGVSCETAGECVAGSGVTADTGFACTASGDVCCRRACPESEPGVMCGDSDNCTGLGGTVNTSLSCGTAGQVCCQMMACPESEPGVMCGDSDNCTGLGGTVNTSLSCGTAGQVCCQMMTCPTTDEGVSCVTSANSCIGAGATVDSSLSCPTQGYVCCRRVCPFDLPDFNCEQPKCSDSYFQVQAPCPNAGDLCCELGLGKR